ncbi:MAG: hypothetical protein ACREGH_02285 [Minisyncoccia bacterium]
MKKNTDESAVGFIGQGYIGKNYADDFERRGLTVVRYALEAPYIANKDKIAECDIVFIAVPTPTTRRGFDSSIVEDAIGLTRRGSTVVIKSTLAPGTTKRLQERFWDRFVFHSPEFLSEKTAADDATHPKRNIIGTPRDTPAYCRRAEAVLTLLPRAPYERVLDSTEAELIKYAGNAFLYVKILFANLMSDMAESLGADWDAVSEGLGADPRIGPTHLRVLHQSGHAGALPGRGAGGHCLIKDLASLRMLYEELMPEDAKGAGILRALEEKNIELLRGSGKDIELLSSVYD